ncbi:MAG: AAA family ATPase [Methanomicrobiaceae archaeon]|nr:AAA family ATPase [Methanomicrobiaceae archaeon]
MRITISGPPGSGTTSLARYLAKKHKFELISAGEVFRSLAAEKGMDLGEFGRLAEEDPAVDAMIDARQKEIGEARDDIVIEGRLAGRMVDNADLRIWVAASTACRAERVADRDGLSLAEATALTEERERCEAIRYEKYYGIHITDLSVYDMVLSSEKWGKAELGAIVDLALTLLTP